MKTPFVSVVMPVYNADMYLIDAVASIIEQSFTDWELICVDDGSQDTSGAMLDWFASQDRRIQVVHQENRGIVSALNTGCSMAASPLICRMDCDDIALADRLTLQTDYMSRHPNCVVVGGAILEMDADSDPLGVSSLPRDQDAIVDNLLRRRTGHFHPTTLIRTEALRAVGGYRAKYQWVEDHDLWLRLARRGQLSNLDEVVLCYRQHASSVCRQRSNEQRQLMNQLLQEAYRSRGLETPDEVLADPATQRAPAGPGKWARVAAKGGFPKSTYKHLLELYRSDSSSIYKSRMAVEAIVRLGPGVLRRTIFGSRRLKVPQFQHWHERIGLDQQTGEPRKLAA